MLSPSRCHVLSVYGLVVLEILLSLLLLKGVIIALGSLVGPRLGGELFARGRGLASGGSPSGILECPGQLVRVHLGRVAHLSLLWCLW